MSDRDLAEKYLETKAKTEHLRSRIEEKNIKELDPLIAHTGENVKVMQLDSIRGWWLWYGYVGMSDPPNIEMQVQSQFKVQRLEGALAGHAASADVYHDDTIERRRKVYVTGRGLKGLTEEEEDGY